jgi:hypothetical protein
MAVNNTIETASPETTPPLSLAKMAGVGAFALGLTLYAALASAATVIFPPLGAAFLFPLVIGVIAVAPAAKAAPRKLAFSLLLVAAFLLAVWPVYFFVKLGPLPILTPPRLVLYMVSALWAYDMVFSPWRRAQFIVSAKKSGGITICVFIFFALGLFSLPFAEGRSMAIPEFIRQILIWLVPYCAAITYCRRQRDFVLLMKVFAAGAFVVALIAVGEVLTRHLLASALSPFIADDAEWLRNVQAQKIRDGVFRAQASHTHPLSLGEHLAFSLPFALAFMVSARGFRVRLFWAAATVAIALGAFATNSRGALLVMVLSCGAMAAILAWRYLRHASATRWRPMAGLVCLVCIAASPVAAIGIQEIISGKGGASAANSTQSRVDQLEQAWPKILKRPVGGYGTGRATRVLGYWGLTLTIDNYYLTLALDYGFPGPLTFLAMMAAFGVTALKRSRLSHPSLGVVYLACFAAAISVAIGRTITSQTSNLGMLFVILGAFAGASVSFSRQRARNRV